MGVSVTNTGAGLGVKPQARLNGLAAIDIPDQLRSSSLSKEEKLQLAAKQFETLLIQQMLKAMRDTVPEGGLMKKNSGEKMFQDMMDQQLSNDLSSSFGLGLGDAIVRQLGEAGNPAKKGGQTRGAK